MASWNYPSFSLLFVAATVVALFFAGGAEARFKGINPWCKTSDYKSLCTKMVNGATTQDVAITNAVTATMHMTARVTPLLGELGKALFNLPNVTKESVISTCTESYSNVADNLKDALTYLKSKDNYTVLDRIQSAESELYDCTEAVQQMGGNISRTPFGRSSAILFKYGSNCLAVATQM